MNEQKIPFIFFKTSPYLSYFICLRWSEDTRCVYNKNTFFKILFNTTKKTFIFYIYKKNTFPKDLNSQFSALCLFVTWHFQVTPRTRNTSAVNSFKPKLLFYLILISVCSPPLSFILFVKVGYSNTAALTWK